MPEPEPTHDSAIAELCKTLINAFVKDANQKDDTHGKTALAKLQNAIRYDGNEAMWDGITALSAYTSARAAERQASALETIARTAVAQERAQAATSDAQALVDDREPKRDYLASTYSLSTEQLSLLWAMRGIVMDAAVASLSRPQTFEPYAQVSSEEMAWTLRLSQQEFNSRLPRTDSGKIDYRLLEEFGAYHYGGDESTPDQWMFGG